MHLHRESYGNYENWQKTCQNDVICQIQQVFSSPMFLLYGMQHEYENILVYSKVIQYDYVYVHYLTIMSITS